MPADFQFDVFLSHSAKDKAVVRDVGARLQHDGVRVWLDEVQIKPGDSIPAKIEAPREIGAYIEVWATNAITFTNAIWQAHLDLVAPP